MSQTVTGLRFQGAVSDGEVPNYRKGKLFVGVLGIEYSIPYFAHLNAEAADIDLMDIASAGNPTPSTLYFSFAKRTSNPDDFAYSDGIVPVYLRFQPDLEEPLDDASRNVASGAGYMSQFIRLEQPTILVEGRIAVKNPDGSVAYRTETVHFVVPINPPAKRVVQLSPQAGLLVFLGRVR